MSELISRGQFCDRGNRRLHLLARGTVGGVYALDWRLEAQQCNSLSNPQQDIITRTVLVVATIMIKADLGDVAGLEKIDRLIRPVDAKLGYACPWTYGADFRNAFTSKYRECWSGSAKMLKLLLDPSADCVRSPTHNDIDIHKSWARRS